MRSDMGTMLLPGDMGAVPCCELGKVEISPAASGKLATTRRLTISEANWAIGGMDRPRSVGLAAPIARPLINPAVASAQNTSQLKRSGCRGSGMALVVVVIRTVVCCFTACEDSVAVAEPDSS